MSENPYKAPAQIIRPRRRRFNKLLLDFVAVATGVLVLGTIVAAVVRIILLPA